MKPPKSERKELKLGTFYTKCEQYVTGGGNSPFYKTLMDHRGIQSFRTQGSFVPRQFVPRLRHFVPILNQFVPNPLVDLYPRYYDTKCLNQSIRTNNDIESWHHSLNRRAAGRCGLPLYTFVALLHKEVRLVLLQIHLVPKRKLKQIQRSTYHEVQRRLFELWEAFNKKEKSLIGGSCSQDVSICTGQRCTELN